METSCQTHVEHYGTFTVHAKLLCTVDHSLALRPASVLLRPSRHAFSFFRCFVHRQPVFIFIRSILLWSFLSLCPSLFLSTHTMCEPVAAALAFNVVSVVTDRWRFVIIPVKLSHATPSRKPANTSVGYERRGKPG